MEQPFMQAGTEQFETLITGLMEREFGCCDSFLEPHDIRGLRENLLGLFTRGAMHPAGVGKNFDYRKNADIRGDVIHWITPETDNTFEKIFLERVRRFIRHLNASCYTGIDDFEFHYAYYDAGSFYKRHLDRFRSDKGRQFSFVLYLNEGWKKEDNGLLSLYLPEGEVSIAPVENRVVFFRSDRTEHEVYPSATRPRLSIAGWLKKSL